MDVRDRKLVNGDIWRERVPGVNFSGVPDVMVKARDRQISNKELRRGGVEPQNTFQSFLLAQQEEMKALTLSLRLGPKGGAQTGVPCFEGGAWTEPSLGTPE